MNKPSKPSEQKIQLFDRVKALKKKLPKYWRKRLVELHPEYDSLEMADYVARVHALRAASEPVTIILEEIVLEYQLEIENERVSTEKLLKRQKLTRV